MGHAPPRYSKTPDEVHAEMRAVRNRRYREGTANFTEQDYQRFFIEDKIDLETYEKRIETLLRCHPERMIYHTPPPKVGFIPEFTLLLIWMAGIVLEAINIFAPAPDPARGFIGVLCMAGPLLLSRYA